MLEMGKEEKNKPRANRKEEVLRTEINKIQKRITEKKTIKGSLKRSIKLTNLK